MKSFIKENTTLVVALTLPILFAAFFYISKGGGNEHVDPPKYDFVIAQNHNSRGSFDFSILNEKMNVVFTYQQVRENSRPYNVKQPELYYVNVETMIAEPISLPIPADANNPSEDVQGQRLTLNVSKFDGKVFNAASISPDGFELSDNRYRRDGNIMTEIFAGHRNYNRGYVLKKDGGKFEIRGINKHYGLQIIGWVVGKAE